MIKEDYNKTTNDIYSATLFYPDGHKDVFSRLVLNYADAYAVSIIVDLMKDKGIEVIDETNKGLLWYPRKEDN